MHTDEHGAFLAPSALFGAAWAARRKASQLLSPMNILLNSKFRIQNLKFPRLSSARPLASPRPSGLRKALASTTHRANHTPNSKLITRNSKLWLAPLSLVTPAASDHLLCQASPACACDVHRVRLGAAGSPFAHLAQRRRDARSSLRSERGLQPRLWPRLFWTGVIAFHFRLHLVE
jgi:hypothetical protein